MAIDLTKLRKLSDVSLSEAAQPRANDEQFLVLVKLRSGAARPSYTTARAEISTNLFSSLVSGEVLKRLESDPDVQSVSISRDLEIGH